MVRMRTLLIIRLCELLLALAVLGMGVSFVVPCVLVTLRVARTVALEGVLIPAGRRSLTILVDLKHPVVPAVKQLVSMVETVKPGVTKIPRALGPGLPVTVDPIRVSPLLA